MCLLAPNLQGTGLTPTRHVLTPGVSADVCARGRTFQEPFLPRHSPQTIPLRAANGTECPRVPFPAIPFHLMRKAATAVRPGQEGDRLKAAEGRVRTGTWATSVSAEEVTDGDSNGLQLPT